MARLTATLAESQGDAHVIANVFDERLPNHEWAAKLWAWAAEQDASHALVLQDDVIPAPNFWPALRAMVEAVTDQVICLEVIHPAACALADEGHRWFTTSDALVGVGYVMPTTLLRAFLAWRSSALKPDAIRPAKPGEVQEINEDTLLSLWCLATGRRIWHPIPTLIDHDTSMASSYANDGHQGRRPAVRWDNAGIEDRELEEAELWMPSATTPHAGRMPSWDVAGLAYRYVDGFTSAQLTRARADDGAALHRRMGLQRRLQRSESLPAHRLYLATPTRGHAAPEYVTSIARLVAASEGTILLDADAELRTATLESADVVRRRSAIVARFLETDCTHLLFVDDDVSFGPEVVLGMLAAGRDVIAAPYPKRDGVDWALLEKPDARGRTLEQRAYQYAIALPSSATEMAFDAHGCTEVAGVGLGCALISRACLEAMVEHYRQELEVEDARGPMVAIFQLVIRGRSLLSEDYSFCRRWRDLGGKVWLYLGEGSPVTHHGTYTYRGHLEAFGLTRVSR